MESFAWMNLIGVDRWLPFDVAFGSLTVVGTPTYTGRYRLVGRKCEFQVQFSASTSIASSGSWSDYLTLPITAKGLGGAATMEDDTTNAVVGNCRINVTNSRCYLPLQPASSDTFILAGWFEV
jgi:hypothetical protein